MKTKVIFAVVAVAALALAAVGLATAQLSQNQTQLVPGVTGEANTGAPAEGFWGWIGNCFGYRAAEPYQGQYVAPPAVSDNPVSEPYQDGGYQRGSGYGYGPCWD